MAETPMVGAYLMAQAQHSWCIAPSLTTKRRLGWALQMVSALAERSAQPMVPSPSTIQSSPAAHPRIATARSLTVAAILVLIPVAPSAGPAASLQQTRDWERSTT